jgi:hypothetical protein
MKGLSQPAVTIVKLPLAMIPASRHYYRQTRLLLVLSCSGLVAAPLLPLLLPAAPPLLAGLLGIFLLLPLFWLGTVLRLRELRREAPETIGDFTAVARNLLLTALLWLAGALALQRSALKLRHIWRDSAALLQAERLDDWRRLALPPLEQAPADCPALAAQTGQPAALCQDTMGHALAVELRGGAPVLAAPLAAGAPPLPLAMRRDTPPPPAKIPSKVLPPVEITGDAVPLGNL